MPLTAIGKVYKPGRRLQATERVVRKRLVRAGLHEQVSVQGVDRGGRIVLRFASVGRRDPQATQPLEARLEARQLEAQVRELMAGFALAWEIE